MDNKRWTAVAGVLLLAGIVASVIFLQQRNEARQRWRESRDQITDFDRRNVELNESLENQKSRLSTQADLAENQNIPRQKIPLWSCEIAAFSFFHRLPPCPASVLDKRLRMEVAIG